MFFKCTTSSVSRTECVNEKLLQFTAPRNTPLSFPTHLTAKTQVFYFYCTIKYADMCRMNHHHHTSPALYPSRRRVCPQKSPMQRPGTWKCLPCHIYTSASTIKSVTSISTDPSAASLAIRPPLVDQELHAVPIVAS